MPFAIAIDGPSGAGKSTLARIIAKNMQFVYVDTGALYRAIGHSMLSRHIDIEDDAKVAAGLDGLTVSIAYVDGEQRVIVNGEDVSDRIRTPQVSMAASRVSAVPEVRRFLMNTQRDIAKSQSVVMDGRDIGTTILPDADLKIYLTATPEARAQRRLLDLQAKGINSTFEAVLEDMRQRDYNDAHRAISPLRRAADAVTVDTSAETLEQSVERMMRIVNDRLAGRMG